jgi:quercetin dioxygenase-like cupin family protein
MPFFTLSELRTQSPFAGYNGKMVHGDKSSFVQWDIEAGAPVPMHNHPHEQIGFCLEGEFEFTVGDETHVMCAGDVVVIPSMVMHGGKALTNCRFVDIFSPVREEYKAL